MSENSEKKIGRDLFGNEKDKDFSKIENQINKPISFDEALKDDLIDDDIIKNEIVKESTSNLGEVTAICAIYTNAYFSSIVLSEFDGVYYYLKKVAHAFHKYPQITEENLNNELSDNEIFNIKLSTLNELLEKFDINKKTTVFVSSIGGQNVVEYHSLIANDEDQLRDKLIDVMITPFDTLNTRVEFQVMSTSVSNEGRVFNVLAVAVDNDKFFDSYSLVTSAGIDCNIMDLDIMSTINLFEFAEKPELGKVYCILDIGYDLSSIVVYTKGSHDLYKRNLDFTYNSFRRQLSKNRDISKDEAEDLIANTSFYTFITKSFETQTQENLNKLYNVKSFIKTNLLNEIQKTFQFYASKNSSKMPEKIFITGIGTLIKNFDDFFGKTVDLKSDYLRISSRFKGSTEIKNRVEKESYIFCKPLGLSLRNN